MSFFFILNPKLIATGFFSFFLCRYILNLLNKFEVALTWDFRTLLIPSLLPLTEDEPENTITLKVIILSFIFIHMYFGSKYISFYSKQIPFKSPKRSMSESNLLTKDEPISLEQPRLIFKQLSRFLLISYFPSGFWSRLMIRILADTQIVDIAQNLYSCENDQKIVHWKLWQCGLELYFSNLLIFKLREVSQNCRNSPYRYHLNKFKIKQDGIWADVDLARSSILEIFFPLLDLKCETESGGQTIVPVNIQHVTKLLSTCVDHVDILLEDWYPTIGELNEF